MIMRFAVVRGEVPAAHSRGTAPAPPVKSPRDSGPVGPDRGVHRMASGPAVDLTLLRGFRYACRPGCGLCCYAEPRVEPEERAKLLAIAPDTHLSRRSGGYFLRARPEGGGCECLNGTRCSVWPARPSPCREFPVSVHVGDRLQASLVLTCPGIDLAPLAQASPRGEGAAPEGFDAELASVVRRVGPGTVRRLDAARRRRRRIVTALRATGQWIDEEEVRSRLRDHLPCPTVNDFPVEDPPSAEEGLELLPLFYAGSSAPWALAAGLGGWEVLELRPEGGRSPPLAVVPPPERPPEVTAGGQRLLEGYLRYFLDRDSLFGTVLPDVDVGGPFSVLQAAERELRAIAALVLSRADVRRKALGGAAGSLTEGDVAEGIRASDQDLLDRPGWGDLL